jgi:AraC family ethanolamine operon transcriptional activator
MGAVTVRRSQFSDFEVLRDAVQDAPLDIVQLDPGKMAGELTHLSVGSLGISSGRFTRGLRSRGVVSDQRGALGTVLDAPATMQHFATAAGDIAILAPGHEGHARYLGANQYVAVLVEPDELFAFLATQPGAQDAAPWHQWTTVVSVGAAAAAANVADFSTLLATLTEHWAAMSAEAAEFFKRAILQLVTAPVLNAAPYLGPHLGQPAALVGKVEEYLAAADARPVHISELCSMFNVSPRTLHRAFIDVMGIPPISFLRRKRLGDVHAALLAAGSDAMVKDIAIAHGFAELGRFAGHYQQMFGELPRETLRRGTHSVNLALTIAAAAMVCY